MAVTQERIRNLVVLAHVDHGKTTLCDSLISYNGIISQRLAGKMRYMDSTKEEQARGITMKASAISLMYDRTMPQKRGKAGAGAGAGAASDNASLPPPPPAETVKHLINLIDSPGHVDFSSDVSTAIRASDGAIVLVDVIEGVCVQTHAVLQQAWLARLQPILVLNKIDRLITELRMSPLEAYEHMTRILGQVNAIMSSFFTSDLLSADAAGDNGGDGGSGAGAGGSGSGNDDGETNEYTLHLDEATEKKIFFSPERGNVVFASALDGWAFSVDRFASMLWHHSSGPPAVPRRVLRQALWGDYYYNPRTKKVSKSSNKGKLKPLFVVYALRPIWGFYNAVRLKPDRARAAKMVAKLGLAVPAKEMNHSDPKICLAAIFHAWLPVADACLAVVCRHIGCPAEAQARRLEVLVPLPEQPTLEELRVEQDDADLAAAAAAAAAARDAVQGVHAARDAVARCDRSSTAPLMAFVTKMFPYKRSELTARLVAGGATAAAAAAGAADTGDSNNATAPVDAEFCFLAFARVFSGVLRSGRDGPGSDSASASASNKLYVLGPTHDPTCVVGEPDAQEVPAGTNGIQLFLMMGRELVPVREVPAGNVCAIAGLERHVLKSATLSSSPSCPSLAPLRFQASPVVRVAVEPVDPKDLPRLEDGMRLLNRADPVVHVAIERSGEHVVAALGELHLARCLKDLEERYAKIPVQASAPLVQFKETVAPLADGQDGGGGGGGAAEPVRTATANKAFELSVRAVPLPDTVLAALEQQGEVSTNASLSGLQRQQRRRRRRRRRAGSAAEDKLRAACRAAPGAFWSAALDDGAWMRGAVHVCGANLLLLCAPAASGGGGEAGAGAGAGAVAVAAAAGDGAGLAGEEKGTAPFVGEGEEEATRQAWATHTNALVHGFHLASQAGPLCGEPMSGVCFVLETFGPPAAAPESPQQQGQGEHCQAQAQAHWAAESAGGGGGGGYGPLSGQIISAMKDACKKAYLAASPRLVEPMYKCEMQCLDEQLGKLYAVISRRRGKVLEERMLEGTSIFDVRALLPVVESFGLASELRKMTSGAAASPQLVFHSFQVLDIDPTVDAAKLYDIGDDTAVGGRNLAKQYIQDVRRRKGLQLDEKVVIHADKQRTRARKK